MRDVRFAEAGLPARFARIAALAAPAIVFVAMTVANGTPALRHDWMWPADTARLSGYLEQGLSGWTTPGFGNANIHLEFYLPAACVGVVSFISSPYLALILFLAMLSLLAMWIADRLGALAKWPVLLRFGACAMILLNPWVYSEVVAGHIGMVAAYLALTAMLVAWLTSMRSPWLFAAFAIVSAWQLQFAILAVPVLAWISWKLRSYVPGAVLGFALLPEIVGLLGGIRDVSQTPYNLEWQRSASVGWPDVVWLSGYFADYTRNAASAFTIAGSLSAICAVFGLFLKPTRPAALVGAAAVLAAVAGLGTKGPVAGIYAFAVTHIAVSGIFRELYDIIAVVAIAYVLLGSRFAVRWRFGGVPLAVVGIGYCFAWILHAPAQQWVDGRTLPSLTVSQDSNTRFLNVPAIQPILFRGAGSGIDPDVVTRSGNIAPLNATLATFPVTSAIGLFRTYGDPSSLRALGVTNIYARDGYETNHSSVRDQLPERPDFGTLHPGTQTLDSAMPLASSWGPSGVSSGIPSIGSNQVAFDDLPSLPAGSAFPAEPKGGEIRYSRDILAISDGWIDARLAFLTDPLSAQPFGGAATTSREPLRVRGAFVLAHIAGTLKGVTALSSSGYYRWYRILSPSVVCSGRCVLAKVAPSLPIPVPESRVPSRKLAIQQFLPFLARVRWDGGSVLRYNVRFSDGWVAFDGWTAARHYRVGGIANAWLIEGGKEPRNILLVHLPSVIQAVLEFAGFLLAVYVVLKLLRTRPHEKRAVPEKFL